jgi:hypothetical protein
MAPDPDPDPDPDPTNKDKFFIQYPPEDENKQIFFILGRWFL